MWGIHGSSATFDTDASLEDVMKDVLPDLGKGYNDKLESKARASKRTGPNFPTPNTRLFRLHFRKLFFFVVMVFPTLLS